MPLAGTYRTQEEIDEWKERDPIITYKQRLLDEGIALAEDSEEIEADVQALVDDAAEFTENSPWPEADSASTKYLC